MCPRERLSFAEGCNISFLRNGIGDALETAVVAAEIGIFVSGAVAQCLARLLLLAGIFCRRAIGCRGHRAVAAE